MNRKLLSVFFGSVVLVFTVMAAEVPQVAEGWVTTAGGQPTLVTEASRNAAPAATVTSPVWATVTPVLLPTAGSPNWATAVGSVLNDVRTTNVLRSVPVTAPTQYTTPAFQKLEWWMLAESTSAAMWRGELNPPPAFASERGQRLWHIIRVRTTDASEGISLGAVTLTHTSTDGNILGETISMSSTSYSSLAFGVKADGGLITAGSASQAAKEVIFLAMGKGFDGGGTQSGLDQIRTWVTSRPYAVSMMASVGGRTSKSSSYLTPPALPEVRLVHSRPNLLALTGGKVGSTYVLQQATGPQGPWNSSFAFEAGEEITPRGWGGGNSMFYRLVAQ